ncbi:MAG: DUF1549 domain-containing protein [Planctomycetota bacterium]|nr:MAG: DUF1549 domain-containing protein [Planctomycetota bacterium]
MWAKNLLFLTVCTVALGALVASVRPAIDSRPRPAVAVPGDSVRAAAARVDAALARRWQALDVQPAEAADDLLVARRMSLALHGTIPSLEDIRHFENLPAERRVDTWLAELLADRRYADYVAERLARAYVGVENGPFLLFRRRRFVAWLADQLAENQPYDRIVEHLIADSGLWTDTPAVNFVTVTINPGDENKPDANRLAARVARAFLGVRLDCAECHDHPFADWQQSDFEGLAAFFGGTQQGLRGIRDVPGEFEVENRQTGEVSAVPPGVPFGADWLPGEGTRRQQLAGWVTHPANRPFAREAVNRAWAMLFGRPLVEPIDDIPTEGERPEVLEILADDFVEHGYDWRRLLEVIASTRAFRLDSAVAGDADLDDAARALHEDNWAAFPVTRLRPEQVIGAVLQSASLATIDYDSNIVVRAARAIGQNEFVERYGDRGADEFDDRGGTIPQSLLMMNGQIVFDKTKDDLLANAATQIAVLAPDDETAIETALLCVLSRRPTPREADYFAERLAGTTGNKRKDRLGDLYWSLLNTTEFSWNH